MHDRDYPTPWTDLFPVISKTLPVDPLLAELARLQAKHGEAKLNAAGLQLRTDPDLAWTMPLLARVDEHLSALAEQVQDTAMLQRDDPKPAAPAPAAEDPLCAAVDAAILALREEMFECAVDECQNTGRHDPNYARADAAEAELLKAIDDLIADRLAATAPLSAGQIHRVDPAQFEERNGLLVEHKPGSRVKGGAL